MIALSVATCFAVSLPTLASAAPAGGGEINTEERAMKAYNDGKAAYDAGDYSEALQLFLEAQSLYPSPVFHYNVGLCQEALENWEQAIISYEAYLRSYKSAFGEDPEDKVNTENKIERIEKQIELDKAEAEAEANQKPEPQIIIQPPPEDDKPEPKPGRGLLITGGVLTGVGVGVAVAGGAIFGSRAANISGQLTDVYEGGNPERVTLDQARTLDSDGRSAQLNQVLMISIGGAVALTGVALLAVGLVKKKKAGGAEATVTPTAGPEGAGLVIRGRF
ncbi:Tetratricopeptide repeat protein [Enhygromyxa salina]|uniref:Tetratricopeptide repeat protein n=1 Tax=Enhygromyxa salina TaxID=215803 RepID=A0A2S9YEH4_9BACT|nr:Tetratricopeptide repeat protein [Enhygromyxa salina]